MSIQLFDTHCHVNDARFDEEREQVIAGMREMDVHYAMEVGYDIPSSIAATSFANAHEGFYAAVGIHPHEAKGYKEGDLDTLAQLLKNEKVRAVGEIGLDFYYDHSERPVQKDVCEKQMDLAYEKDAPVIYHVRDAHMEMLQMMKDRKGKLAEGIIHCFSGSAECAKEYLKLGYYISFAGPITFKKAPNLIAAAEIVPLDRLLIETDAPYLSPEPKRGRRNEPAYVRYVAQKLAEIKGISIEELAQITTRNAQKIYRL
jgi:hydrolase, TatD family